MLTIEQIRKDIVPIAQRYGIKKACLFGSYAKGTANEESDVDILIEKGAPLSLLGLSGMRQTLQDVLRLPVDLVTTSGIDQDFYNLIKGTEIVIYEE